MIGDEAGPASFLGAYVNTPLGYGSGIIIGHIHNNLLILLMVEVFVKKGTTSEGEQSVLEITSCQWQNDNWLEIKNQVVKHSDGYLSRSLSELFF